MALVTVSSPTHNQHSNWNQPYLQTELLKLQLVQTCDSASIINNSRAKHKFM